MFLQFGCCRLKGASWRVVVIFRTGRQTQILPQRSWVLCLAPEYYIYGFFFFFSPPVSHHCSPLCSLPSVWTLLWPQRAVSLWLSLPTPLRQQDLYVLLPPQQHRLQVLLQRDWVPVGHAGQPHHHPWWLCTQVSNRLRCHLSQMDFHCESSETKICTVIFFLFFLV